LSLMLLFAAGLLIASFLKLQQLNPGFNYRQLATFETTLSVDRYGSPASLERFLQDALQRIQKLPGSRERSECEQPPHRTYSRFSLYDRGRRDSSAGTVFRGQRLPDCEPRLFPDHGDSRPQGTAKSSSQTPNTRRAVVVINQAMARQYFPNENPIGKRIVIAQNLGPDFAD